MVYLKICGIASICSALILVFVGREKELTALISSLLYVTVMLYAIARGEDLVLALQSIFQNLEKPKHCQVLLKTCGIALTGTVASSICNGVGQKEASKAIEFLTVLEIMAMSVPVFKDLLTQVSNIFGV